MLVLKTDYSRSGIPRHYLGEEGEKPMLIDTTFKKSVVFIGCRVEESGVTREHYGGTAFFVSVKLGDTSGRANYLVTAKHNIDKIKEILVNSHDKNSVIRVNKHDGTSQIFNIPLDKWEFHPTEEKSVDAAVVQVEGISQNEYDWLSIPAEWTDDFYKIKDDVKEGEDVFVIGLFRYHYGNKKNYPMFRAGNIALLPEEKVYINKQIGEADTYLIETRSLKGLSGSPVFASLNPYHATKDSIQLRPRNTKFFYWLGLVSGHFLTKKTQVDYGDVDDDGNLNVGISFVVPSYKIVEILNRPDLKETRRQLAAAIRKYGVMTSLDMENSKPKSKKL